MNTSKKTMRTCPKGHVYEKSSTCPVCPICEKKRNEESTFLHGISAPARRALEGAGIRSLKALAKRTEAEILSLHGMGPASLPKMRAALKAEGLSFKK